MLRHNDYSVCRTGYKSSATYSENYDQYLDDADAKGGSGVRKYCCQIADH